MSALEGFFPAPPRTVSSAAPTQAVLEAHHLAKNFGASRALSDASLTLNVGEIVAVMGPSGSGKSTLLHCAAGILRPDAGEVFYGGVDLTRLSAERLSALRRTEFGFVFQFGQLVPELSAIENVALPLILGGSKRRAALAAAEPWLVRLGIEDLGGRRPGELSGGQAQRVAVARALITHPSVVFADEPTGALDMAAGIGVMEALIELSREHGAAVVIVTHEAQVAAYADRLVTMRDGRTDPAAVGEC
ncbi:ABC transporter ATP-binding protein [Georgenia yuyongxinii]